MSGLLYQKAQEDQTQGGGAFVMPVPKVAGGKGLFSLYEQAELSDTITRVIDSTIQACINDKSGFYTGSEQLTAWRDAAVLAGDLVMDS